MDTGDPACRNRRLPAWLRPDSLAAARRNRLLYCARLVTSHPDHLYSRLVGLRCAFSRISSGGPWPSASAVGREAVRCLRFLGTPRCRSVCESCACSEPRGGRDIAGSSRPRCASGTLPSAAVSGDAQPHGAEATSPGTRSHPSVPPYAVLSLFISRNSVQCSHRSRRTDAGVAPALPNALALRPVGGISEPVEEGLQVIAQLQGRLKSNFVGTAQWNPDVRGRSLNVEVAA